MSALTWLFDLFGEAMDTLQALEVELNAGGIERDVKFCENSADKLIEMIEQAQGSEDKVYLNCKATNIGTGKYVQFRFEASVVNEEEE